MDRLPLVQALTAAGLERLGAEQVATALGDAIESSVATKGDIANLKAEIGRDLVEHAAATKGDIARVETTLKSEITRVETTLKSEIGRVEVGLKAEINRLDVGMARSDGSNATEFAKIRAEMHAMEMRLTFRLGGLIITAMGLLFALLRLTATAP